MTVHFIGAGPGAADLLTLRAVSMINLCPVCVYAGTYVPAEVLAHCPPGATLIDSSHLDLDQITEHLVSAHQAGQEVARLCSGDPSLYSALAEQTRRLDRAGVPWDVNPGVPAYAAAAALIGRELTVPEVTQTVILTRTQADSTAMPESESLARLATAQPTFGPPQERTISTARWWAAARASDTLWSGARSTVWNVLEVSRLTKLAAIFGSLIVQTYGTSVSRMGRTNSVKRANRSTTSGQRHPPCRSSHRGIVKWLIVTLGATPAWRQVSIIRR
jgi:precorrin-6B methylase 1